MSPPSETVRWEKVYIFISSTFNDMHAERDYLVKRVFPQLADWCEARRLRMVDVDLRWGVTEQDATRNANVVQVCLQRIDECRPFFLCLLGQRYGWVPRGADVSGETLARFPGLEAAVADGCSVTELEILHAIVRPFQPESPDGDPSSDQALFYLRHPASLRAVPREPAYLWRTFSDRAERDPELRRLLLARRRRLRKETLPATRLPVRVYRCAWDAAARSPELEIPLRCPAALPENVERWRHLWRDTAAVRVDGLEVAERADEAERARAFNERLTAGRLGCFTVEDESLAACIQRDLQAAIEARYPGRTEVRADDDLDAELNQQAQFQFVAGEGFVDREGDFEALDDYLAGPADRPLVLSAPGGMGKTMLLARWVERAGARLAATPGASFHTRFVGASDGSTTVASLLHLLLREFGHAEGKPDSEVPDDPVKLRHAWHEWLAESGARGPTLFVIDALDQLGTGLADLAWIPLRLPAGVKLVVSFRRDATRGEETVGRFLRSGALLHEVPPFETLEDRRRLVRAYLAQYLKELDQPQLEELIHTSGAANPLFLKVALSELRVFGAFANLAAKIEGDFGTTPQSAFNAVLRRLEGDPAYSPIEPAQAVPLVFGTLAHARRGLSTDELAATLCSALGHDRSDPDAWEAATDAVHLLLRQVRPFLARREGRYDFFYESFRQAAVESYVAADAAAGAGARPAAEWHGLLADYFHELRLWLPPAAPAAAREPQRRKVGELPYHLTMAGDIKRLGKTLTDLEFIEAKCGAGLTYDLLDDHSRVPAELRTPAIEEFAEFVRAQLHVLAAWPELTFQQAANTIAQDAGSEQSAPAKAAVYRQIMGFETRPWLRRLNPEPTAGACLMTLAGHRGPVASVVVSPDGEHIISVGHDGSLRVWDVRTGSPLAVEHGAVGRFAALALVPGTTLVAVGAPGGRIAFWDFDTLQKAGELAGPAGGVNHLAVDRSGRWLAAGSSVKVAGAAAEGRAETLVVYDFEARTALDVGSVSALLSAVAIGPDARFILAATQSPQRTTGATLLVIEPASRSVTHTLPADGEEQACVALAPDGATAATGGLGGAIRLWDTGSWRALRTLSGPQGIVQDLAFSPDGRELVTGGLDDTLKVWDPARGQSLTALRGHTGPVLSVAYTADGSRIVSASRDGTVRIWDPQSDRLYFQGARKYMVEQQGPDAVRDLGVDGAARWFEEMLHLMTARGKHWSFVTDLAFTPDGRRLATASFDDRALIWSMESGKCEHWLEGHEHGAWELAMSDDGRRLATADAALTLRLWDTEGGSELAARSLGSVSTPELDADASVFERASQITRRPFISPLLFAAGDSLLLSADTRDPAIKAWDATTLEPRFQLDGHTARVRDLATSADGRRLVSAGDDGTVIVWDLEARRPLATAAGYAWGVSGVGGTAVGLLPDEGRIVCAWHDGTLKLLDLETLREVGTLGGPESERVLWLEISADGALAAAARGATRIEAWRLADGELVFQHDFDSELVRFAWERGGRRLATGGPNEALSVWDIDGTRPPARFPAQVSRFAFHKGRIAAANDAGDVFLLELTGC